jgi:hypothetical protein
LKQVEVVFSIDRPFRPAFAIRCLASMDSSGFCLCIGTNDAWDDGWLGLWSSNRYLLHRSPRFSEAQTDPGQGTGTWVFSENIMTTLLYRGQAYATPKTSDVKACIELTYRHEHYNTCRELVKAEMQEHPTLTYRGVSYSR